MRRPLDPESDRINQLEGHVRRLIELVLIDARLTELMGAQRGAAPRAVRDDLEILIEQSLVEDRLELPPDALDVLRSKGPVGVIEVGPVPDSLGQGAPIADITKHRLLAQAGELGDADLVFDLLLPGDAEALLDLDLDWQTVGVPAGASIDTMASHRLESAEQVLVGPSPHVVQAWSSVRCRRALEEDPGCRTVSIGDGTLEDIVGAPALELSGLDRDEIDLRADRAEHEHSPRRDGAHILPGSPALPWCPSGGLYAAVP